MKKTLSFALLVFAPVLSLECSAFTASPSSPLAAVASPQDRNKAVAMRVFEEILNHGQFQVADEVYAPDFVNHGLHRNYSLQQDQAAARWEKTVCPDLTATADLIAAEGDLVTVVWTARGTHTVSAGWLPATGVRWEEPGITVWRIVDGKIRDEWTAFDELRIARQAAAQLKWLLMGLLCAVMVLAWLASRLVRKLLRLTHSIQAAKAIS
jgi:predicted ester cyclase